MPPALRLIGDNGSVPAAALQDMAVHACQEVGAQGWLAAEPCLRILLPALCAAGERQRAAQLCAQVVAAGEAHMPILALSRLSDRSALSRAVDMLAALPLGRARALGAIACAWHALDDPARAAQALRMARQEATPAEVPPLIEDHLAIGDLDGAVALIRAPERSPDSAHRTLYRQFLEAMYRAGRLGEGLALLTSAGDILDHYHILHPLIDAPLARNDAPGCMAILQATPRVYADDLLKDFVPRCIEQGRASIAEQALTLWDQLNPNDIARLGAWALLGEVERARAALRPLLEARLQVEEVPYHNGWIYRELGLACSWAGDVAGALAALERVADHDVRMDALLQGIRYAPPAAREALLCAARGLAAGIEDDRLRTVATARLARTLAALGRRKSAESLFEAARRTATSIRRPRSDQGVTRRAAIEAVLTEQLAAQDLTGAFRTARKLRTRRYRDPFLAPIAVTFARAADIAGAIRCLEEMAPGIAQATAAAEALSAVRPAESLSEAAQQGGAPQAGASQVMHAL